MNKDRLSDRNQAGAARVPLAAHPLFPAIVALWLAALLAIGSLLVPAGLLERAVAALGIDSVVPAARAPLGFTARLLVAFVLGFGGAIAGFLGARRLADRSVTTTRTRRPAPAHAAEAAGADEPAPATDDDDESEDLARLAAARNTSSAAPQRRRGLTSETDDSARPILEISAIPALEPLAQTEPAPADSTAPQAASATAQAPASPQPAGPHFRNAAEMGGEAAIRLCAAPLESLGVVQLVERFALAIQARRLRDAAAAAILPTPPAAAPFHEPGEPYPAPAGRPFDMPFDAEHALADEPAPGLLRARPAPRTAHRFEPQPAPPAMAAPADPAAELARWSLPEPEGEGDDVTEDLLPDPAADSTYSSLLDMRPATRVPAPLADFVRVEDHDEAAPEADGPQPVVVFPGQAVPAPPLATHLPGVDGPASPVQTEQALREALAALQRMSGAA